MAAEGTAADAGSQSDEESIPNAPASSIDTSVGSGGAEASGAQPLAAEPPDSAVSDGTSQNDPPSGDDGQDDPADEDDSASEELSDEETLLLFAACMRENGLPDFEDPTVDANDNVQTNQMFADSGVQLNSEEFRQAISACNHHLEGVTFGQGGGGGFNLTETQDTLLGFARCLRLEGIEVDDPELSKLVTGGEDDIPRHLFGAAFDVTDPAVQNAVEACSGELGGLARAGG